MSVIEVIVERISQDISCEKEVVVLEVIDNLTLASNLQAEIQNRTDADDTLSSEIQRVQQEYDQALLALKTQMEADLASLRSELLQHLNYAMYLNLPLGGTK